MKVVWDSPVDDLFGKVGEDLSGASTAGVNDEVEEDVILNPMQCSIDGLDGQSLSRLETERRETGSVEVIEVTEREVGSKSRLISRGDVEQRPI